MHEPSGSEINPVRILIIAFFILAAGSVFADDKIVNQYCIDPSFSDSNDEFVFISNLSGDAQLWTKDFGKIEPTKITAEKSGAIRKVLWNPNSPVIAYSNSERGGDERGITLISSAGEFIRQVTPSDQISRLQMWSQDGRTLYYSARGNGKGVDLYAYDMSKKTHTRFTDDEYYKTLYDSNSEQLLVWQLVQRSEEDLIRIDIASGRRETIIDHADGSGTIAAANFLADGSIVAATDMYSDRHSLVHFPVGADKRIVLEKSGADLVDLEVSPNNSYLTAHWKRYGVSSLQIINTQDFSVKAELTLPFGTAYRHSWSHDSAYFAFQYVAESNNIFLYNMENDTLEMNTSCQSPARKMPEFEQELRRFKSFDGLEIDGWLMRASDKSAPTVIVFHGGPESESYPSYSDTDLLLLDAGINVFHPNVRGSTGRGKLFVTLDNKQKRFDAIKDIKAVHDYLVSSGIAKEGYVAAMGGSYGGYMTNAALAFYPQLFKTGISMYGISKFLSNRSWFSHLSKEEYGDPESDRELLADLSPLNHAESIRAPMLFINGAADTNSPVEQSLMLMASLKQRGIPTDILVFEDEGHGIVKSKNRQQMNARIMSWLRRYLLVDD